MRRQNIAIVFKRQERRTLHILMSWTWIRKEGTSPLHNKGLSSSDLTVVTLFKLCLAGVKLDYKTSNFSTGMCDGAGPSEYGNLKRFGAWGGADPTHRVAYKVWWGRMQIWTYCWTNWQYRSSGTTCATRKNRVVRSMWIFIFADVKLPQQERFQDVSYILSIGSLKDSR